MNATFSLLHRVFTKTGAKCQERAVIRRNERKISINVDTEIIIRFLLL